MSEPPEKPQRKPDPAPREIPTSFKVNPGAIDKSISIHHQTPPERPAPKKPGKEK